MAGKKGSTSKKSGEKSSGTATKAAQVSAGVSSSNIVSTKRVRKAVSYGGAAAKPKGVKKAGKKAGASMKKSSTEVPKDQSLTAGVTAQ